MKKNSSVWLLDNIVSQYSIEAEMTANFLKDADEVFQFTVKTRRDLHTHPELGFREFRTAGVVVRELNHLGLEIASGIAETGVSSVIVGDKPGKVCMVRFDMDALPIVEETGKIYASQNPGVMHACGHDAHVAIGLSLARILVNHKDALKGKVKLIFQPAEEGLGGAEKMVHEGILENPRPDYALGIHVWNEAPLGWLGITPGPIMAASEIFTIVIRGRGGHGALPNRAIDPIIAAVQIINALQSIISRNIDPLKTGVISVTSIHAGQTHNVIPQDVELKGTIRTFDNDIRELVLERFKQIIEGISCSMNCQATINIKSLTPAVVNHEYVTNIAQKVAKRLWPDSTIENNYRTMGSEDMAYYLSEIPGCFILIGSANKQLGLSAAHHHPNFDIDEKVMSRAVGLLASIVYELLD